MLLPAWSMLNCSLNVDVQFFFWMDCVNTLPTLNTDLAEQPWTWVLNLHWPALKFKYQSINHRHINRARVPYLEYVLGQIPPLLIQVKWLFIVHASRSANFFSDPQTKNRHTTRGFPSMDCGLVSVFPVRCVMLSEAVLKCTPDIFGNISAKISESSNILAR